MSKPGTSMPLLLLPGTLCDVRAFGSLADAVDAPAIPIDLTGFASVDAAVDAILDHAPARFIPVGFSLGGIVALALARRAPSRVAGMVLAATNCRDVPTQDHPRRRAAVRGLAPARLVAELWPTYVHPQRIDDGDLRQLVFDMARGCPPGTAERQTELAISRTDSRAFLSTLTQPALVIAGTDDAVTPLTLQRELAAGLPQAQLCVVEDAGHFVLIEQPDACQHAFSGWFQFHADRLGWSVETTRQSPIAVPSTPE